MAYISKITISSGTYDIKDAEARSAIDALSGYTKYLGVTTTVISDGSTAKTVTIDGSDVTANTGDIVNYKSKEFIFNGTVWQEFGDLSGLGELAFADTATGKFTPAGTVSQPSASADTSTTTVNSIENVGTLPSFTVTGETLTLTAGSLPTKGQNTTVVTAVNSITVSQPTFSGTQGNVSVSATAN